MHDKKQQILGEINVDEKILKGELKFLVNEAKLFD